ncbi:hypothetical protein Taro_048792 [Colocasia esculenta]|uniref:Clp R domain-containing protein n=1 Tax=Colocasia esculenta TaxID=4460 RepID=A0A843X948_COLES|nr:hypothetical protein [Colocasia esculenta]
MRAGGSTVQQALTPEAASIVKQAVTLARRRGHAQVTPLHVANIMLSSSTGLLRAACLQSHSHPLQCKALELCFNVALNRLPASTSSVPMLAPGPVSKPKLPPVDQVRQEDVMTVVDFLVGRKKRSVVVVGECLATTEGVVKAVMDNVGKADVPEVLRNIQFISLPLMTFRCLSREDVEKKVGELRCLVKSCCVERGAVLYLGDLKWATEYRAAATAAGNGRGCYCPVEHVTMELGRLVSGGVGEEAGGGRFWLVGVATYQTYMKCRAGRPSLEAIWGLHPLTIPAGSLGLSLSCDSGIWGDVSSRSLIDDGGENKLSCCRDCSAKFEIEARGLMNSASSDHGSVISTLPPWLQQYKEENRRATSSGQDHLQIRDLCKKWNSICSSSHKHHHNVPEKILSFSSVSPTSSSISSYDQQCNPLQPRQAWPVPINSKNTWRDHHNWISQAVEEGHKPTSGSHMQGGMLLGSSFVDHPNPNPNAISTSSSETMEVDYRHRFKELNAENLKTLCLGLEKKVAWQKDIIPEIAGTVLRCRSGMVRRKDMSNSRVKEDTWLFFQGGDNDGKEKMARGLACLVFGSQANFMSIGLSSFSSTRSGSSDDLRNKRSRSEASHSYIERFAQAVRNNPHSVVLMEDVEQMDYYSQMGIKNAIERGRIRASDGEEVGLGDAIVILSCESFDSRSRACSPSIKQKCESEEENGVECGETTNGHCVALDLNLCAGDDDPEDWCFDDIRLLELVDGRFFFKLKEDL